MGQTNGSNWEQRMDRFERGLEHLAQNSAKHDEEISALTAKVSEIAALLNRTLGVVGAIAEAQKQLTEAQKQAAEAQKQAAEAHKQLAEAHKQLAEGQKDTDSKLNALIGVVDDLIRRDRPSTGA